MLVLLLLSILSDLYTLGISASIVKRDPITWSVEQCNSVYLLRAFDFTNGSLDCAKITVPLDYADTSKGNISLQLARIPASQQPSKGGIFYHSAASFPGTVSLGQIAASQLAQRWGADWDIISWDSRGVWASEPVLKDLTTEEKEEVWGQTTGRGEFESHGNLTTDADAAFFRSQASAVDQGLQKFDQLFKSRNGANLTYIGTVANVRDIVAMSDVMYGSDKDINFYGMGLGAHMGLMLTQMFPNRIGKVILDGVLNPQALSQYLPILGLDESLADAPQVLEGFYNTCALAGPDLCPIARQNPTAGSIKNAMNQFLDRMYNEWNNGGGFESYNMFVASDLWRYLVSPFMWAEAASILASRFDNTTSGPSASTDVPSAHNIGYLIRGNYTVVATTCADVIDMDPNIVTTERVFEEVIRQARTGSFLSASIIGAEHFCHRYTSRSVERYMGPWNVQPKNVVLVIGNQADPIAPFRNAQFVTKLLGGKARLVQQAGYGHTSIAIVSNCTINTVNQFLQGTIPEDKGNDGPDVVCEVDEGPFRLPGNTPWNITTSQNGDQFTSGPNDPGLANFPGLGSPPPIGTDTSTPTGHASPVSRFEWSWVLLIGFGMALTII